MEFSEQQKQRLLRQFARNHPLIAWERLPFWFRAVCVLSGCAFMLFCLWCWYLLLWAVFQ